MRALLAAELGLLSDDAVVPLNGRTLMQGPAAGEAQDDLSSGDENEDANDVLSLAVGHVLIAMTAEIVKAALELVFRGRERLLPAEIMNFPSANTLKRYMTLYKWAPRKPNIQNPHLFAGSSPPFLDIYFRCVRRLFSELKIRRLSQIMFQDEIIFCAELDKVKRLLKVLVTTKSDT